MAVASGHAFLCASTLGMMTALAKARDAARGLGTGRLLPRRLTAALPLALPARERHP